MLGPIPFFFQFDFGNGAYWGLVDSFLASVSALSLALALKSIEKKSTILLVTAILVASLCPFIKPSGCFIFLLIALCWSAITLLVFFNKNNEDKKVSLKFWWLGTTLFLLTGLLILYAVLTTHYLGQSSVNVFAQTMIILNDESKEDVNLSMFVSMFYDAVGPQFLLYASFFIFLLSRPGKKPDSLIRPAMLLFSSFIFIIIGIWFWVWMTGISQIRYFYPFLLLGFVPLLYYTHDILRRQGSEPAHDFQRVFKMTSFLPAINILLLLSIVNPNITWQKISGASLNIRIQDPGVKTAKQFLSLLTKEKETATVYDVNLGFSNISFSSYGYFDHLIHPDVNGFTCIHPIDYLRPSTYRMTEILLNCNYIIYYPMNLAMQTMMLADTTINSFNKERQAIEAFLNSLTPAQGLQTILEEQDCKLSKITNKIKLMQALEPFLYSRHWRPIFMQENKLTPQGWKLFQIPFEGIPKGYYKDTSTLYGGYIDSISSPETIKTNTDITLDGWLAYDIKKGINADEIFIVVIYPDGTQQYWPSNHRSRPDISERYHLSSLIDAGINSTIQIGPQAEIYTLMFALGYKGRLIHCDAIKRTIRKE